MGLSFLQEIGGERKEVAFGGVFEPQVAQQTGIEKADRRIGQPMAMTVDGERSVTLFDPDDLESLRGGGFGLLPAAVQAVGMQCGKRMFHTSVFVPYILKRSANTQNTDNQMPEIFRRRNSDLISRNRDEIRVMWLIRLPYFTQNG